VLAQEETIMTTLSIASVTVAHNSERVLAKQLDALLRQRRALQEIVVVNNNSTDGTCGMLSTRYPEVTVLNLPTNIGVGGGYAAGIAYAVNERKHNWVWLLDDDSVPKLDGLEALIRGLALPNIEKENIGIVAPLPVHGETQLSYPGLLWYNGWKTPPLEVSRQPAWFVDAVISSGSLLKRDAVEHMGLPRVDFFMDFVDFEYCFRLRRGGYKIAIIRDSELDHTIGEPRSVTILGYTKSWPDQAPWREYYVSRNYTFTIWDYFPNWRSKMYVVGRLIRHAAGILAFGTNKRACAKMMLVGFLDGRAGRLGIRFLGDSQGASQPSPAVPLQPSSFSGH
jgi:rhamnosyltransferase